MRLGDLLHPIPLERFWAELWENEVAHVRTADRQRFAHLFALADVDEVIAFSVAPEAYGLVSAKTNVFQAAVAGPADLGAVYAHFSAGHTVVVNEMQDRWEPVQKLANALQREVGHPIRVNAYVTPPHTTGFRAHYDGHDVFVLQVHGTKRWSIFERGARLPLPFAEAGVDEEHEVASPGACTQEIDLAPGDVLYVPRGVTHRAAALDDVSIHLTVGVYAHTWETVLSRAVADLARTDPTLDRPLPVGFASGAPHAQTVEAGARLRAAVEDLDLVSARRDLAKRVRRHRRPQPGRRFARSVRV